MKKVLTLNKKCNIIILSTRCCTKSTPFKHFSGYYGEKFQRGVKEMRNNMRLLLAKQRKKTADVAEATGISKSTLTALYYERAKSPTLDTLKKVSSYLGVTIDEFLDVED